MRSFFFFQAEDGIRDADVTGVQTCALPISRIVRATRAGGDAVHVREHPLVGRLGPGEGAVEVEIVLLLVDGEYLAPEQGFLAVGGDLLEEGTQAVLVVEHGLRVCGLVVELDREATVEIRLRLERLRDELRVEANGVEDLVIGPEEDGRAAATGGTDLLEGGR